MGVRFQKCDSNLNSPPEPEYLSLPSSIRDYWCGSTFANVGSVNDHLQTLGLLIINRYEPKGIHHLLPRIGSKRDG